MRAVGLVGREEIDIGPERLHVGQAVGRIAHAVHAGEGARRPRGGADLGHRIDLAHDVRAMRETDQAHPPVGQKRRQARGIEMARFGIDAPFADLDPLVGEPTPDAAVGLVVLVRHDDGPALARKPAAHRLRQNVGVGRGRGAEGQLVLLHPHQGGEAATRLVHLGARRMRGGIGRIGLHLALVVEAAQPVDHRPAGVGASRILEEGLSRQRGFREGGEKGTDVAYVEQGHANSGADRPRLAIRLRQDKASSDHGCHGGTERRRGQRPPRAAGAAFRPRNGPSARDLPTRRTSLREERARRLPRGRAAPQTAINA